LQFPGAGDNNFLFTIKKTLKMEQSPPVPPQGSSLFEMDLDAAAQNHLNTISKWGKFIAITVLIIIALGLLGLATQYERIMERVKDFIALDDRLTGILIAIVLVFAGLAVTSLIYLLRACILIRQGLVTQNTDRIGDGFKAFKVVFIISIIFSSLAILSAIFSMINS
jgi:hypothetical protein